jgi:hypothetical protein
MPAVIPSKASSPAYRVFVSHGGADNFIIKHVAPEIEATGATVFIDKGEIKYGDDFRERIFRELLACNELLILLTPTSVQRPWIFAELGVAISRGIRVVTVVYGVPEIDLQSKGILSLIGTNHYVELNSIEAYYEELRARVSENSDV